MRANPAVNPAVRFQFSGCLFCQQCRLVSVDTQFLLSHLVVVHSEEGVAGMLGEDPRDCISRLKRFLKDTKQKELMFRYQADCEEFTVEYYRYGGIRFCSFLTYSINVQITFRNSRMYVFL